MTRKCAECGGPADFATTNGAGVLCYCIPCAKKLARELELPALAHAARDAEQRKAQQD